MKKALNFFLLSALLLTSCKKDQHVTAIKTDPLPPATTAGLNTLGCYVNGNVFKANLNGHPFTFEGTWSRGRLLLQTWTYGPGSSTKPVSSVTITTEECFSEGVFTKQNKAYVAYFDSACNYNPASVIAGELTITKLDQAKRIISGTFWQTLYLGNGCDTLKITDGRFDLHF